jgi:hypothetical protein
MNNCRILIISDHPLFAQGVERLINGQAGLQVVDIVAPPQASFCITHLIPDVVIIDADRATQPAFSRMLRENPGVKFIALSLEDNDINIYYQRSKTSNGVEALVEAIREPLEWKLPERPRLRLLIVAQGAHGQRIAEHIRRQSPVHWLVSKWVMPELPQEAGAPGGGLPDTVPTAELVIGLAQGRHVAPLLLEIITKANATSAIIPICDAAWLPREQMTQLQEALDQLKVASVFPKPFCSLTETHYTMLGQQVNYHDGPIVEFARHFGQPTLNITADARAQTVRHIRVLRDCPCGCAQYMAEALVNVPLAEASQRAQSAYRQFPCQANLTPKTQDELVLAQTTRDILHHALSSQLDQLGTRPTL